MRKHRVVITTTLNDNLFHAKLQPLLAARKDIEVVVVTDRSGPPYQRVRWVYPRGIWKLPGRLIGRFVLLLREILRPGVRVLMAYNVIPHGLLADAASRMRHLPVYLHFIAGKAEIEFAANPGISHNRVILRSRHPEKLERLARRTAARATRIFVPGRSTEEFLKRWNYPAERISRLHSAVDLTRFHPSENRRDIAVLVVAQLREGKRPLFTLQILQALLQAHPLLKFAWLGDGPLRDQFLIWLNELNLQDALQWHAAADVPSFYQRSQLYLLCSLSEGLSLSCMEAMACGVVPLVSDCGDMAEVAGPFGAGSMLPQSAEANDYVREISGYLDDPAKWSAHSDRAVQHIRDHHSVENATRVWQQVLLELLGPEK